MRIDFTKLIGFTVEKVRETEVKTTTTCVDCDCEENNKLTVVSFINDCDVQQDIILRDGRVVEMTAPFCAVEDDE